MSAPENPRRSRSSTAKRKNHRKYYFTERKPIGEEESKEIDWVISRAYRVPPGGLDSLEGSKEYWKNEKKILERERKGEVFDRHTHKSRLNSTWKMERLYVAEDTDLPGKSIAGDLDPEFFKIVSCRPIKSGQTISEYLKDIRDCFLTRLKTGFRRDEIFLAEEDQAREKKSLEKIRKNFSTFSKAFDEFLEEDYLESAEVLERVGEETRRSANKSERVNRLRKESRELEMEISEIVEEWRKCKNFQKFLNLMAPTEWRKENDPDHGKDSSKTVGEVSDHFSLYRFREFREESTSEDLDSKMSKFAKEVEEYRPPVLHETDPRQILDVFADLEKNNLRAWIQCNELDLPVAEAGRELEKIKSRFEHGQAKLEEEIDHFEEAAREEEEKWRRSEEEVRRITFGLFRNLIANDEYLSIVSFLEDAYEESVAPTDTHPDLMAMMREIEIECERISMELDNSPSEIVKRTRERFLKGEKRQMAEAREAGRKVRQMERLLTRLTNSLGSPKKGWRERKMGARSRSSRAAKPSNRRRKSTEVLGAEEEKDQIFFFTERETEANKLHRPLCV